MKPLMPPPTLCTFCACMYALLTSMYSAMEMALCMFADYVLHKACCTVEPLSVPFYFLGLRKSHSQAGSTAV